MILEALTYLALIALGTAAVLAVLWFVDFIVALLRRCRPHRQQSIEVSLVLDGGDLK